MNDVSDDEYIEIDEEQTINEENKGNSTNEPEDGNENDNASSEDSDNSDESDPFKTNNEDRGKPQSVTKSERISNAPNHMPYDQESNEEIANTAFTKSELDYYNTLKAFNGFDGSDETSRTGSSIRDEIVLIGAGVGGGFTNTQELHVMKYKKQAVGEELDRFIENEVFEVGKIQDLPKRVKMLTSTWAMKRKSNREFRAKLKMRGYEQDDGEH